MTKGKFVISLDFEIYWGVRDVVALDKYRNHLKGVREVMPMLLQIFTKYGIEATFATVGLLFSETKTEMKSFFPMEKPSYINKNLSPYECFDEAVGDNEQDDPYHFGWNLIEKIRSSGQEIGSHTFCHYYCLEPGQNKIQFQEDMYAAINIANKKNIKLKSFVFPKNEYNKDYLNVLSKIGFTSFRGIEKGLFYNPQLKGLLLIFQRPLRLLDSYLNLSGHNTFILNRMKDEHLINIRSSRFLRPYSPKMAFLEKLRLRRILKSMTYAAKNSSVYHLWWHPHNFGIHQDQNFAFLEKILSHYSSLNKKYNFESVNMSKLSEEIIERYGK